MDNASMSKPVQIGLVSATRYATESLNLQPYLEAAVILQCSECNARFLVPDQAIGADGRTVRCGKCQHTWFQAGSPQMDNLPDLDSMIDQINARPKPMRRGSNLPVAKKRAMTGGQAFALASLALAAAGLVLLLVAPGMYGQPSSKGLVLADVGIVRMTDKDRVAYQLNGKIANTTAGSIRVPVLRVTLVDAEGASLQYWDFSGDVAAVEPHKDVPFATGDLDIRFTKGVKFVAELGSPLELALRRKPAP